MEAIRALMVAKRSARNERTQAIDQGQVPDRHRARGHAGTVAGKHTTTALVAGLTALRPRPGDVPGYATRIALRELGERARSSTPRSGT